MMVMSALMLKLRYDVARAGDYNEALNSKH